MTSLQEGLFYRRLARLLCDTLRNVVGRSGTEEQERSVRKSVTERFELGSPLNRNRLKIAFVVGGLPFGGVESMLLLTVRELRRLGHEPVVINISGTGELDAVFREQGFVPLRIGDSTNVLKTTRFDTTCRLRAMLKALHPDLIHTSHFSAHYHTRLAAIRLGIPIVTHCHNIKRESRFFRRLADRVLSFVTDMHIAVAEAVAEQGVRPYNWGNRPCAVLYNAIDPVALDAAVESPLDGLVRESGPVLFSVCRLVTQKNMDLLIRVAGRMKAMIPDMSVMIVGDGPERSRLEALAAEQGVADRVVFTGFRQDVPGLMKALSKRLSLFVMPSQFEGFGNAPLEGFHFGIPAVISPQVPLLEVAGDAAVVVDLDEGKLVEAIRSLLADPSRMKRMGEVARTVAEHYGIGPYVERLLRIYGRCLRG